MTERALIDWPELISHPEVQALIALAIAEDVGDADVTTSALFTEPRRARAKVVCREAAVVAGLPVAEVIFRYFDHGLSFRGLARDGEALAAGSVLFELEASLAALLTAERVALNFLMRLCGVATATRHAVDELPPATKARIYDTRKTTPGWRRLEKAAVRAGGGCNHRLGLHDAVLIKDNHLAALGSLTEAVHKARAAYGDRYEIEVEIDSLAQLEEALASAPDIILLDNFCCADMEEAVRRAAGRVTLEASGGLVASDISAVAKTGVERISMGAITHSAKPIDLSLEVAH